MSLIAATSTPWWAPLIGVVIGGLVTGLTGMLGSWWLSRKAAAAAEQVLAVEMQEALKIVGETLLQPSDVRKWPPGWKPWCDTWMAFREPIARRWSAQRSGAVATAYARMHELAHGLETKGEGEFSGNDQAFFDECRRDLTTALRAIDSGDLQVYSCTSPPE